jgi:predicted hotdog family 3-hydroxylacyl-ACP dehydratase
MKTKTLSDLTLEDLLPHRGNMMFVDEVLEVDAVHAVTICRTQKSWPMADNKGVHPLILIELAAQTAGVCNGWDRIQTKGIDSEKMGWLVGIKGAQFFLDYLPFGSCVKSSAENTYNFANLREVSCEQTMDDKLIAKITLQLFQA